jgi:hypothetical protein
LVPAVSWTERLKKHRKNQADSYAKTILADPEHIQLYQGLRYPGLVIIMGDIRAGKTGLAHEIASVMHERKGLPCCLHLPVLSKEKAKKVQRMLPSWMKVTRDRSEWGTKCVVIYDEAAMSAHSRRSASDEALELDELVSIAGQREQLILFISHYSRKIDVNLCTAVHRIIWKRPTYAHMLWERDELGDFTTKAYEYFRNISGEIAQKRACLILDLDNFSFKQATNKLPSWFTPELSCIFKDMNQGTKKQEKEIIAK